MVGELIVSVGLVSSDTPREGQRRGEPEDQNLVRNSQARSRSFCTQVITCAITILPLLELGCEESARDETVKGFLGA
jgi:hypothetical protein